MIEEEKEIKKPNENEQNKNNPLHGIKLKDIVGELEAHYGWEFLGQLINIRCFQYDPSLNSCLKFLRKNQWARDKVEKLYLSMINRKEEEEQLKECGYLYKEYKLDVVIANYGYIFSKLLQ